jgi:hypothetical protein
MALSNSTNSEKPRQTRSWLRAFSTIFRFRRSRRSNLAADCQSVSSDAAFEFTFLEPSFSPIASPIASPIISPLVPPRHLSQRAATVEQFPLIVNRKSEVAKVTWTKFPLSNLRNPLFTCSIDGEKLIVKLASRVEAQRHCALFAANPSAVAEVVDVFSPRYVYQLTREQRHSDKVCMAMTMYQEDAFSIMESRDSHDQLERVFVRGLQTLQSFHRATGHVHADVKGENFVHKDDGSLALIDFEFSCKAGTPISSAARMTAFLGTDMFAAQECFVSNDSIVGFKADVYSWAVSVLTHVSSLNDDFDHTSCNRFARGIEADLHLYIENAHCDRSISKAFADVLKACTRADVSSRFSTEEALAALLA